MTQPVVLGPPWLLNWVSTFPTKEYLKGSVVRVTEMDGIQDSQKVLPASHPNLGFWAPLEIPGTPTMRITSGHQVSRKAWPRLRPFQVILKFEMNLGKL